MVFVIKNTYNSCVSHCTNMKIGISIVKFLKTSNSEKNYWIFICEISQKILNYEKIHRSYTSIIYQISLGWYVS